MSSSDLSSDATDLARAMREGLEQRRLFGTQPFGQVPPPMFTADVRHALAVQGDLLNTPAVARPGRLAWAVRLIRRLLGGFLRPWLAVQTRYNLLALEALEALHNEIDRVSKRPDIPKTVAEAGGLPALGNGLVSCETAVSTAPVPRDILEYTFILAHLPAPPSDLLLVGSQAAAMKPGLVGLGYQVHCSDSLEGAHLAAGFFGACVVILPGYSRVERAQNGMSVFFDTDVLTAEAPRVLRDGGRYIAVARLSPATVRQMIGADGRVPDIQLPGFRRSEIVLKLEGEQPRLLTNPAQLSTYASMQPAAEITAFIVAEKH